MEVNNVKSDKTIFDYWDSFLCWGCGFLTYILFWTHQKSHSHADNCVCWLFCRGWIFVQQFLLQKESTQNFRNHKCRAWNFLHLLCNRVFDYWNDKRSNSNVVKKKKSFKTLLFLSQIQSFDFFQKPFKFCVDFSKLCFGIFF